MKNSKNIARIAGLMYLVIIITGLFSEVGVRENLINWEDASTILQQVRSSESSIRAAFVSDTIMVIADIILAVLFFYLLRPANELLSRMAMAFRLIQAAIIGINLVNIFAVVLIANGLSPENYSDGQIAELVMFFFKAHNIGYLLSGVFFGISCLFAGLLFKKNDHMPSLLGYFLIAGGFAYLFVALANFLIPSLAELADSIVMVTAVFSELSVCLYLLIKGTKN